MNTKPEHFVERYFSSWWIPAFTSITIAFSVGILSHIPWYPIRQIVTPLLYIFTASLLGILAASVVSFAKKRCVYGIIHLLLLPVAIIISVAIVFIASFMLPSEDGFANNLTIPKNIEIISPLDCTHDMYSDDLNNISPKDKFQQKIVESLKKAGSTDPSVTADISSLVDLYKHHPQILNQYLACSPCWRVFEEHGQKFATRRWFVGSHWHYELHGYYSNHNLRFQSRTTIGLTGKPWARIGRNDTILKPGETKKLKIKNLNSYIDSHCIIQDNNLVVEIHEESYAKERRLTKATLDYLNTEFGELAGAPDRSKTYEMVSRCQSPPTTPTIKLWNESQPGIYEAEIWANPGESGKIYLRAYEVTHNTRLSKGELNKYSNEWIGWSDDPKQLFLSNTLFMIDEGDWGKPYAARFEVWFVPDSGKPERKLMQKIFKIEGWQR